MTRNTRGPDPRRRAPITTMLRRRKRQDGSPPVADRVRGLREPAACERCLAIYRQKTWRPAGPSRRVPAEVAWTLCPACAQVEHQEYFGRIRVGSPLGEEREGEVRRRVWNVERRARARQPERRLVRLGHVQGRLEVLTTSQKLAHRIARELEKAFGGRVQYVWSDREGLLDAAWDPEARRRATPPRSRHHTRTNRV